MWLVSAIFAFSVAVLVHAALGRLKATNLNIGISFLIVAIAVAVVFLCLLVMSMGTLHHKRGQECGLFLAVRTLSFSRDPRDGERNG